LSILHYINIYINISDNNIIDFESYSTLRTFFGYVLIGPLIEEVIFRYFLRYKGIVTLLISQQRWNKNFPYVVYLSIILFAFPITKSFADKYSGKLQAVSVLQSPDATTYQQFGALSTENWAIVYAEDFMNTDAYIQYQENATPTFLLFDKTGKLIDRWTGALIHQQKLEQYLGK